MENPLRQGDTVKLVRFSDVVYIIELNILDKSISPMDSALIAKQILRIRYPKSLVKHIYLCINMKQCKSLDLGGTHPNSNKGVDNPSIYKYN